MDSAREAALIEALNDANRKQSALSTQLKEMIASSKLTQSRLKEISEGLTKNPSQNSESPENFFTEKEIQALNRVKTTSSDDFGFENRLMSLDLEKQTISDSNLQFKGKLSFEGLNHSRKNALHLDDFKYLEQVGKEDHFTFENRYEKFDLFVKLSSNALNFSSYQLGGNVLGFKFAKEPRNKIPPSKLTFTLTTGDNFKTLESFTKRVEFSNFSLPHKLKKVHMYPSQGSEGTKVRFYRARSANTTYAVLFDGKPIPFFEKEVNVFFHVPANPNSSAPSSVDLVRRTEDGNVDFYRCYFFYTKYVPVYDPKNQRKKREMKEGSSETEAIPMESEERKEQKHVPCKNVARYGKCSKPGCKYDHEPVSQTEYDPQGNPVCDYFAKTGYCKYGDSCRYSHNYKSQNSNWRESSDTVSSPSFGSFSSTPRDRGDRERTGPKICKFFSKHGRCDYGDSCVWSHQAEFKRSGKDYRRVEDKSSPQTESKSTEETPQESEKKE